MAVRNYAFGTLNPVVYFINARGVISLPPSTEVALTIKDRMAKRGFELREAGTLAEIDRLQKRMEEQERQANYRNLEREEGAFAEARKSVRDRLVSRMVSSSCSPYEREFIQAYLMLRDEKREEYRKRFTQDQMYFEAREFNESSQHIMTSVMNNTPDSKDTACEQCGNYRKAPGMKVCARCASGIR